MGSSIQLDRGEIVSDADARVVLYDVSWLQYETMLAWRGEKSTPRYAYLEGALEITSPSSDHERIKSYIGRIVEAYAMVVGVDFTPFGSWTLRNAKLARGVEPDECYVWGAREQSPEKPDLAIEVIWTSGGIDKLAIYRGLEIPEVWSVRNGVIEVRELVDGDYRVVKDSVAFPKLDLQLVMRLVGEPTASHAMRKMTAWAKGQRP